MTETTDQPQPNTDVLNAVDALIEAADCLVRKFAPGDVIPEWRIEDLRARADAVYALFAVYQASRTALGL